VVHQIAGTDGVCVFDHDFRNGERKDIELGISDGFVEIKSGISEEDKIKVWNAIEKEEGDGDDS